MYRILTLDGGGIRGLLMAVLLERIEEAHPGFLAQVDLFAGTSTGGLLALGLAAGKTPAEAIQIYEQYGQQVFRDTLLDNLLDLGSLIGAQYDSVPLREALQAHFGDLTLGDLQRHVLVSAFDLDNSPHNPQALRTWKAKFFHNYLGTDSDAGARVVDVALYTSAAPSYFPTVDGYIDGGVVANNPSMCALAQALNALTGGRKLEEVVLFSLGTGQNPHYLDVQNADWGLAQWAPHMLDLMMEGSAGLADYQVRQLLGERYRRFNPVLPQPVSMDQVSQMPLLRQIAMQVNLQETLGWANEYFAP
jgi:uncharacterized protein